MEVEYTRYTNCTYDGQAQIVAPGPTRSQYKGFMSTLQLEGIRDGIEDLELYKLLQRLVDTVEANEASMSMAMSKEEEEENATRKTREVKSDDASAVCMDCLDGVEAAMKSGGPTDVILST